MIVWYVYVSGIDSVGYSYRYVLFCLCLRVGVFLGSCLVFNVVEMYF